MNLDRWDIVFVRADEKDAVGHPAVILSSADMLNDPKQQRFNVLIGTKKQPAQTVAPHQVVLNGADELEFLTLVDCSLIYLMRKSTILRLTGRVTPERRKEIQRKLRAFLGLG